MALSSIARCSTCPGDRTCVAGHGPRPARVMCIGEAPGRDEDFKGVPFIGYAGREFNENYLFLAGLKRQEVYVTNTRKCRPDLNRKPTYNEATTCAGHFIPEEIQAVQPEVIILMGATACSLTPDIDLETEHGIPRKGELYGWPCWIVPMFHPAAGLHDTAMMTPMLQDWSDLGYWLHMGRWMWAVDDIPNRDYRLCRTV